MNFTITKHPFRTGFILKVDGGREWSIVNMSAIPGCEHLHEMFASMGGAFEAMDMFDYGICLRGNSFDNVIRKVCEEEGLDPEKIELPA